MIRLKKSKSGAKVLFFFYLQKKNLRKIIFFCFFCIFLRFFVTLQPLLHLSSMSKGINLLHNQLIDWYERHHRILPWRETTNPYHIWISEVILQQTRVEQGLAYYYRFIDTFPNAAALANASEEEVLRLWQGLGYYSRARNLHKAAKIMAQSPCWTDFDNDALFRFLLALPGVGEYTAGAIASFAFNLPYPALDGNVYRVLSRLYDCDIPFDTTQGKKHFRLLAEQLLDRSRPRLFNSAIMELGALHCVPSAPDCPNCPLLTWCQAAKNNTVDLLPVRKQRPKLRDRYFEYHIYLTPERTTLLHRRTENDIWKHLYEFPLKEYTDGFPEEHTPCIATYRHVLSHQRIHTRFLLHQVNLLPDSPECIALALNDIDAYPISRLTMKAIEVLEKLF